MQTKSTTTTTQQTTIDLYAFAASHLFNESQTSEILGVTPGTLGVWRSVGRYNLPFVKVGRLVRYRAGDIQVFIESRMRNHTGDGA